MTSGRRTLRLPASSELPLGSLLLLELAAAVAGNALRAHHVAIQGDFFLDETVEVTAARVLAHACDQLAQTLGVQRNMRCAPEPRQRIDRDSAVVRAEDDQMWRAGRREMLLSAPPRRPRP